MKGVIKLLHVFSGETWSEAKNHNTSLPSTIHRASYLELMKQLFYNQSIYRLRRLDNQRTKTNAAGATGRAREFCWLFECDWTRAVWRRFSLNHLVNASSVGLPGDPKKYSCLIKRKIHNKRGFYKNEICLDCRWADLNFDMLALIFCGHVAHVAEIYL